MDPCTDLDQWSAVIRNPNGTLTAQNVSEVLKAVTVPPNPLNNFISIINNNTPSLCMRMGSTSSCSCPDGGTVTSSATSSVSPGTTTTSQCTVATVCGVGGLVVDGSSAMREVSRLDQGKMIRVATEAYRYSQTTPAIRQDVGFFAEFVDNQLPAPARWGVPVDDGVVAVAYDRSAQGATATIFDTRGTWACGALSQPMGTCQRGTTSLTWQLR